MSNDEVRGVDALQSKKKMKTKPIAIVLILISTIFTSAGQIFWKFGSETLELNLLSMLLNYGLIIGLALNAVAMLFGLFAYKNGEFSVVFPFMALNFIWVSLISSQFLDGEAMNTAKWGGIFFIAMGVVFTGIADGRKNNGKIKVKRK